jgi:hypothetical protein
MPSSTSSFEVVGGMPSSPARSSMSARTGFIVLVTGLAVIFLGLELGSPLIVSRLSRTERRVESETRAASALHPVTPDGRPTVLLTGNSLLIEGVQLDPLRDKLAPQYAVSRLAIEQTHYLDWYFGLRRLLEEGSHPSVIVLSLATDQLASRFTLGESFARRQLSARDFKLVVQEAKLDKTTASTYLFAHWSNWLADKGFIRQDVLILLVPNFRALAARIADHGPHVNDPSVLLGMAQQRLPELRELAQNYGVTIVLLVPPTLHQDHSQEIQELGDKVGVPVWVLSPPGEFPRDFFRDGFHLNLRGSGIFTARLADQIRKMPVRPVAYHSARMEECDGKERHSRFRAGEPNDLVYQVRCESSRIGLFPWCEAADRKGPCQAD